MQNLYCDTKNLKLKIVYNSENKGFSSSCDKLMQLASGEYLWIIGGQDIVYLTGLRKIDEITNFSPDYIICNARIKDESSDRIVNESLWGDVRSKFFTSIEDFFEHTGGPCQAISCNVYKVSLIRKYTTGNQVTHLWGFIERIMAMLLDNRNNIKIYFSEEPMVEMLIESDGWQAQGIENFGKNPAKTYGSFTPVLQISELYNYYLKSERKILKFAAPFRDPLAISRTFVDARARGLPVNLETIRRVSSIYKNSLSFWFLALPVLLIPRQISILLNKARPIVHFIRKCFSIRTF